jgi:hypothetical protein
LAAILSNTEAAQMLLKVEPPDLAQINEILSDIVRDERTHPTKTPAIALTA